MFTTNYYFHHSWMNLQIIFLINKLIVWVYETLDPRVTLTTDKFRNETLLFKRKVDNLHI